MNAAAEGPPETSAKPKRATLELEVVRREHVTPHLVRLTLGGPGIDAYVDRPETDKYLKFQFLDRGGDRVKRTYTIRRVNALSRTLEVDFVVHGDEGIAAPWAAHAEPGETVTAVGPGGGYVPSADADWYLFVGDASALPAIAAALDALGESRPDAVGAVFIDIEHESDMIDLFAPEGIEVNWLVGPPEAEALADAVREWEWSEGTPDIFAHGERGAMKSLRKLFRDELDVSRKHLSLSGYWARGRNEDRFQAEKREPIGQIFPEE